MKHWFIAVAAVLAAGTVFAQRNAKKSAEGSGLINIIDITDVKNEGDYSMMPPLVSQDLKTKIQHRDSWRKESNLRGWHYFEVAYAVGDVYTDDAGKKMPVLALPEVTITYALLYDMTKSQLASRTYGIMKKAKSPAVGWDNPNVRYALLIKEITYVNITPNREHYAAVCVPPAFAVTYGLPICYSVRISVNGEPQGPIVTKAAPGAKVDGKPLAPLLVKDGEPTAWWETIRNLSDAVDTRDGVLRDRSLTPFSLAGDEYYDPVKVL